MGLDISVQPTPNPNALKFVLSITLKNEGKATFTSPSQCESVPLAFQVFQIRGVDQVHFFKNSVTVSKFSYLDWEEIENDIMDTIALNVKEHDPDFETKADRSKKNREDLSPEMQKIEEILDQQIRPGLQGDGGDLETVSFENDVLLVKYQGACGTCPSSTTGTLEAIRAILRDEYDPNIQVYIAPEY